MRTARTAVVTTAALVFTTMLTVEPASATPGELDTSFGTGGSTVAFKFTTANAVAVQRDGKIVVAGQYQDDVDNDPAFYVGRFQSNGQPDPAFGDGGMVITDFGASDWATGVAVQKNGRIVAAGITQGSGGSAVALARYTRSGHLDSSFGGDGVVVTDVTPDGLDYATGVVAARRGRLVVSGVVGQNAAPDFDGDMLAVRYLASGRRDRSFGRAGIARVDIAGRNNYANDLAVTRRGRVLLAGQTEVEGSDPGGIFSRAVVARLKRDGTRDRRFGKRGIARPAFGGVRATIYQMARRADGRLLVAGVAEPTGTPELRVGRLRANGRADTSFAGDGVAAPELPFDLATGTDVAPVVGGRTLVMVETPQGMAMVRLQAGGGLDPTFGTDGSQLLELDGFAPVMRVVSGGRVVVAGTQRVETEPFVTDPWTVVARFLLN
jgi:uncharacterized delta-60 repeat protein